jgi:hypothetical protein
LKHKHYEVIIAYALGKEVQCYSEQTKQWIDAYRPSFLDHVQYRVKPEQKSDFEYKVSIFMSPNGPKYAPYISQWSPDETPNLKVVFDGETRKLKSAEVIK